MKNILFFTLLLITNIALAQKMITRNGKVSFEASTPSFEAIKATNTSVSSIMNTSTGDFVALILIKSFKFKLALMEEHFNENYLESNRFPKATFKGKILNFESEKLSKNNKSFDLEGDLTIHGVTKKIKTKINMIAIDEKIITTSDFEIIPQDFNIQIPSLVKDKIAKVINTSLQFEFTPQK